MTATQLQQLITDLGIKATTIYADVDGGYKIDWNGDVDRYADSDAAEAAIRHAAS